MENYRFKLVLPNNTIEEGTLAELSEYAFNEVLKIYPSLAAYRPKPIEDEQSEFETED